MKKIMMMSLAASLTLLAGCAQNPYQGEYGRTTTGATVGAGVGALAGNLIAGSGNKTGGTLIGAAVGAGIGGLLGNQMDKQAAQLQQQMANTGVEVQRQGDGIHLQAPEAITFATNSATLNPQFMPVLQNLAQSINQYPGTIVRVEGNTDSTGSAAYNQQLSQNRAQSVASALSQYGVPYNRIQAIGYGMTKPIASNATAQGRAQNRRVDILIVPAQ
ncbi:MAG: cell envelope biogenesis protein OmpA [Halothiobacillus sp. 24-54-40]|jgi:outer membrane protein OmpA-like peptidoglycan-associated protein|nr:OmpA family protein [Halothiobacillaceae bacterium]OYZ85774.1 MAG: cell envelope biogenesis protein OmpA [Halothiobacillus sp. 24-54-40]HQS03242.1 OmpA family protein [Halothiobacillus sp.]HQS29475.1 OmpA family protein [Halothiobacillus sp.]